MTNKAISLYSVALVSVDLRTFYHQETLTRLRFAPLLPPVDARFATGQGGALDERGARQGNHRTPFRDGQAPIIPLSNLPSPPLGL